MAHFKALLYKATRYIRRMHVLVEHTVALNKEQVPYYCTGWGVCQFSPHFNVHRSLKRPRSGTESFGFAQKQKLVQNQNISSHSNVSLHEIDSDEQLVARGHSSMLMEGAYSYQGFGGVIAEEQNIRADYLLNNAYNKLKMGDCNRQGAGGT